MCKSVLQKFGHTNIPTAPTCSAGPEKWIEKYYLKGIACAKINGHESQPNDAGGVHSKTNEFGLVEVFRDLKKITHFSFNSLKFENYRNNLIISFLHVLIKGNICIFILFQKIKIRKKIEKKMTNEFGLVEVFRDLEKIIYFSFYSLKLNNYSYNMIISLL